jgi:hypothetical protein
MIADTAAELADLWPALAAALERDTVTDTGTTHSWAAAVVVNADVLAAMLTIDQEIPQAARLACEAVGEPWQHRDLDACLLALPRLADRLHNLGMLAGERHLCAQCAGWLRLVKRALGLRRPDVPVGYACPRTDTFPEDHADGCALIWAGDEGFLRQFQGGLRVEWVLQDRIYCAGCGAAWGYREWHHLGMLLGTPALAGAG